MSKKAQENLATRLRRLAEEIRTILGDTATAEVIAYAHSLFRAGPRESTERFGLGSPYRQGMYVLGLMLTTPGPDETIALSDRRIETLNGLVRAATDSYLFLLTPPEKELAAMGEADRVRYAAAAPAFMHHFFTGVIASGDQVIDRARTYLLPFDTQLLEVVGLTATDAMAIAQALVPVLQREMDEALAKLGRLKVVHDRLLAGEVSFDEAIRLGREQGPPSNPLLINWVALREEFGLEKIEVFRRLFEVTRGTVDEYTFFTEACPLDTQPLIRADDDHSHCPLLNTVFLGLLNRLSNALETSKYAERFYRHRDRMLEKKVKEILLGAFNDKAEVYAGLSELPNGRYEHDVVLIADKRVLVIECKASPPREPFRDVERSYQRLRDGFRSETGIQKAYNQAMRVVQPLRLARGMILYKDGEEVVRFPSEPVEAWPVCVTADDYGVMATDLSLLLQVDDGSPHAWAINVFDLEALCGAWRLKKWGVDELFEYIAQRVKLHGSVQTSDELELAGMFLRHATLPEIPDNAIINVDPAYADVFDAIYFWKEGAGPAPDLETRGEPVFSDATATMRAIGQYVLKGREWLDWPVGVAPKLGRNLPCPCGSGRKFKKCHGRPGIQLA